MFISGRYSSRHCAIFARGKNVTEPSGHPECGPSVRWRREWRSVHQGSGREDLRPSLPGLPPARHSLRRWAPSVQGLRPESLPSDSALLWAVPAQAPERVWPPHEMSVFAGGREPKVSRPLSRQSPPRLPCQTLSGAYAPLRSAPLMVRRARPRTPPSHGHS